MSQPWQPATGSQQAHQGQQAPPPQGPPPQQWGQPPQATPRPDWGQQNWGQQPPPHAGAPQPPPQQPYPGQPQPGQPTPGQAQPGQPYQGHPYPGQPQPGQYPPQPMPQGWPGQQFGQGPVPTGSLTLPGWGAVPAALGTVLMLLAMFLLPWLSSRGQEATFLDIWEATSNEGFVLPQLYVVWLAFIMLAVLPLSLLPWTLGVARTQTSAKWWSGIHRHRLSHASFTKYRVMFGGRATVGLMVHAVGILSMFEKLSWDLAASGPFVLLGGAALMIVGAFVGPRKGPGLPPQG